MSDRDGTLQFERRARVADANGDGLDASEFRSLIADLERSGQKVSLRGRIELRSGVDAHELPSKALAIRDCANCHDANAARSRASRSRFSTPTAVPCATMPRRKF